MSKIIFLCWSRVIARWPDDRTLFIFIHKQSKVKDRQFEGEGEGEGVRVRNNNQTEFNAAFDELWCSVEQQDKDVTFQ